MTDTRETPPTEIPPTEASRVDRGRRRGPMIGIAVAVVVVLVAGGIFLATRGKGPLAGVVPGTSKSVGVAPGFRFQGGRTVAIATVTSDSSKKLQKPAQEAAAHTTDVIHLLYTAAFLDPANWKSDSYDSAFEVFSASAMPEAKADLAILTAGDQAGETYSTIQPTKASIFSEVLMDSRGQPFTVVAKVKFTAEGARSDGSATIFVSDGSFFLRKFGAEWKVVAFEVHREDKVRKAQVTPSGSATPSGASS